MDNNKIIAKANFLETQRKTVEQIWDVITKYVMPNRSDFFDTNPTEQSKDWHENRDVFDSTASQGLHTLSASIHGSLTSPSTRWFEIAFRNPELKVDQEARKYMENATNITWQTLIDSNFNLEVNETYIDLAGYGTSVLIEEEDPEVEGNILFKSIPLRECYFESGHSGQVINLYRRLNWTPLQIFDKFGDEGTPQWVKEASELSSQSDKKILIVFCIYKRNNKKDNTNHGGVLAPSERPFGFKWVIKKTGELLGEEGGYYEQPAFVPRWRIAEGSQWGYSPSHLALPNILTANKLVQMTLTAVGKVIDPAILTTERGILSDVDLSSGGITVVKNVDDIKAFESRTRFDVGDLQLSKVQTDISQAYYVDQLQMKDSPSMTATEVQVRFELMQRLLGSTAGRLENDLLSPCVQRTFNILFRAGKFGELPDAIANLDTTLDITYTGALSRAQKTEEAGNVERLTGLAMNLANANPEVIDTINWDKVIQIQADLLAVPASVLLSKTELNTLRNNKKQAMEQQAKLNQEQMQAETNKTGAETQQIQNQGEENEL